MFTTGSLTFRVSNPRKKRLSKRGTELCLTYSLLSLLSEVCERTVLRSEYEEVGLLIPADTFIWRWSLQIAVLYLSYILNLYPDTMYFLHFNFHECIFVVYFMYVYKISGIGSLPFWTYLTWLIWLCPPAFIFLKTTYTLFFFMTEKFHCILMLHFINFSIDGHLGIDSTI